MAEITADDSVALHTSRDSESETDDERLERRMRRAVIDPTVLDGNFSDDEPGRRLRSSSRKGKKDAPDEPPTMEVVEEPGPSNITSREAARRLLATSRRHCRSRRRPRDLPSVLLMFLRKSK
jgi:hypothetical protein